MYKKVGHSCWGGGDCEQQGEASNVLKEYFLSMCMIRFKIISLLSLCLALFMIHAKLKYIFYKSKEGDFWLKKLKDKKLKVQKYV